MNLVESDSREFLLNRFNRRVESYRLHHDQNYRLYQPIRREEVRKQLEETTQLHKRWIEFQAKRTVGKAKNDNLNSSAAPFGKKKKKLPISPETTSALSSNYGQSTTNTYNKTLAQTNPPALCQNFSSQNVYQNYDQSGSNNKNSFNSDLDETSLFQTNPNTEAVFSDFGSKSMDNKLASSFQINSNLNEHFPEARNPEENHERLDEDKEEENFFMDEEWKRFWESINKDGEMPKEFLQVLQENECDDPSASGGQNFLHDDVAMPTTNVETLASNVPAQTTASTTESFAPCGIKSNFPVQPMQERHSTLGFTEQGVIRNNPHFPDQNLFNPTSRMFCGSEGTFDGLPSYEDVVNGRFNQPAQFQPQYNAYAHRNQIYPSETYRPAFVSQQQFYHQGQQTLNCRKQSNFISPNFLPCPGNNPDLISDSLCYQPSNNFDDNLYSKDFQTYSSGLRFSGSDYGGQTYCKTNSSYEFYAPQQSYVMDAGASDSQMAGYQANDRNSYNYWSCHSNLSGPYQKQGCMSVTINTSFHPSNNFPQQSSNNYNGKHLSDPYSTSNGGTVCMADVQHVTSPNISVDTELSMIEDIINKR